MSPYMLSVEDSAAVRITLSDYDITENGFLPSQEPLSALSNSYYSQWEAIASNIPGLIRSGQIRAEVKQLPVLSTAKLHDETEWRRAYVVLAFIAHAYIWGGDKPEEILPPSVAIPFTKVSKHLELPPVATYAALCLWNYQSLDKPIDFMSSETLCMVNSLTGTEDEAWFYLISVMVEGQGARAIPLMLNAMQAASQQDYQFVIESLLELRDVIKNLGRLLERMYERCQPSVFYHEIRPMLAGSKNMAVAGLPRGVYYDSGNGQGEWMQLRGGSNAQSSLIQFFDAVLGVEHESTGEASPRAANTTISFHEEMRAYMPGSHRRFLEKITEVANIRPFAFAASSHPMQAQLLGSFQAAVQALSEFRAVHMQIVARYIIIPSRQAAVPGRLNLAVGSQAGQLNGKTLTGTGGTDLVPFLKKTREETDRAGQGRLVDPFEANRVASERM
ncbi:uncharacterized protein PV09_00756 [Verruconis gallopava]|uniref:Indoleamine 2,3-dioxygenase n=1 Tax=Verruconis gallopava TaxID=253628 RepID=A0A0D1Y178_9PEZI|nr:uncharacterized protein PV09_00756 [Verruconis gallopava]KIW08826.1 hypothetical protein PV09_00756 [Verruconis gallopava]